MAEPVDLVHSALTRGAQAVGVHDVGVVFVKLRQNDNQGAALFGADTEASLVSFYDQYRASTMQTSHVSLDETDVAETTFYHPGENEYRVWVRIKANFDALAMDAVAPPAPPANAGGAYAAVMGGGGPMLHGYARRYPPAIKVTPGRVVGSVVVGVVALILFVFVRALFK